MLNLDEVSNLIQFYYGLVERLGNKDNRRPNPMPQPENRYEFAKALYQCVLEIDPHNNIAIMRIAAINIERSLLAISGENRKHHRGDTPLQIESKQDGVNSTASKRIKRTSISRSGAVKHKEKDSKQLPKAKRRAVVSASFFAASEGSSRLNGNMKAIPATARANKMR